MPRKKTKNAVLVGLLGIAVSAVGHGAQRNPVTPPSPSPLPAAPGCTLTAAPSTIERGQSVTLSWTSQSATDMDLQPGVGMVQAQGSSSVKPDDSTTYTITAKGPGGNIMCTARVTVQGWLAPPPAPFILSVAWNPDRKRLAAASNGGVAKVWAGGGKEKFLK